MEEEKKPLIIPRNCPALKYVINGFTATDIRSVVIVGVVGLVVAIASFFRTNNSIIAVAILIFFCRSSHHDMAQGYLYRKYD